MSRSIVSYACTLKVKKLKKYRQDWIASKIAMESATKMYTGESSFEGDIL